MTNEIKEILVNIKNKYEDYYVQDIVSGNALKQLLDYITNLQEEIKRQEKSQVILDNQNADLQQRINKAIELIDEPIYYCTDKMEIPKIFIRRLKEVKEILQGEDNDNR